MIAVGSSETSMIFSISITFELFRLYAIDSALASAFSFQLSFANVGIYLQNIIFNMKSFDDVRIDANTNNNLNIEPLNHIDMDYYYYLLAWY